MLEFNTLKSINEIPVVLASSAPWRSDILTRLGIKHTAVPHQYDEEPYMIGAVDDFVSELAIKKAHSILYDHPDSLIIACDQVISLDGKILGKSGTPGNAARQLRELQGQTHQLFCSVAVLYKGYCEVKVDVANLTMRELSKDEIFYYVDQENPVDCAGSYKIEALGGSLFEKINCNDPNTIIGLPGNLLLNMLRELGYTPLLPPNQQI